MLKIGEFSRLSQVTVKTLHHYDDLDLLKPIKIDPITNYRYYSIEQLPRLHRIMALKELGLSLEQIALMIDENLSLEQMRGMLSLKHAEIQQRVNAEQNRLQRVEFHLRMLELEGNMPSLDVVVKEIPSLYALTLRRSMKPENMVALGMEFEVALAENNVKMTSPVTEIRFQEEYQDKHDDVEFVLPVASTQTQSIQLKTFGILEPKLIEGVDKVASFVVRGMNPQNFAEKLSVFQRWIVENGYQLCAKHRLVFHRGPTEHAEYKDWIVEFQHEILPI